MATGEKDPPSSSVLLLFQYAVSQLTHKAMSLGVHKPHIKDYTIIDQISQQVVSLVDDLPAAARPLNPDVSWDSRCPNLPKQRFQISITANSFIMALHRAHAKVRTASRQTAVQAALSSLDAQDRLFELVGKHHYKVYTLSFYTIDAAIFLAVTTAEHPPTDPEVIEQLHHALRQAIRRLGLLSQRSGMAKTGERMLTYCYQKMLECPTMCRAHVNESSSVEVPERTALMLQDSDGSLDGPVPMPNNIGELKSLDIIAQVTEQNFEMLRWMEQMERWEDADFGFGSNQIDSWNGSFG